MGRCEVIGCAMVASTVVHDWNVCSGCYEKDLDNKFLAIRLKERLKKEEPKNHDSLGRDGGQKLDCGCIQNVFQWIFCSDHGGESLNHDSHYSKQAIEPQSVIEQVARNIHDKVTPTQAINILQSLKYMLRLGTKDDVLKEVSKSVNYQTRALTGEWRK